jgi:hypothetical protein
MTDPVVYKWFPAYQSAVLETDRTKMPSRIDEALKAIALRFCEPGPIDDVELNALAVAQDALMTLKA